MTIQQHLAMTTFSHALATPTTWQARRDYRRAQCFARSLELAEARPALLILTPKARRGIVGGCITRCPVWRCWRCWR